MNWLSLLSGRLLGGIDKLAGRFLADKDAREANVHGEQIGAMDQMSAEFQFRGDRTWFDSLIDGINRLPRPVLAGGVIYLFVWCVRDPLEFTIAMQALGVMPEWLAIVIGQVILLYMGGRMLDNWKIGKAASADQVRQVLALQQEVRSIKQSGAGGGADAVPMPDAAFEAEMLNTARPMSNAAIIEWNRRRAAGWRPKSG